MSEDTRQNGEGAAVTYELMLTEEEARQGTSKLLPRNNKRLQVRIPAGVATGSIVRLTNALQVTDDRPGDILISVRVKPGETSYAEDIPGPGVIELDDSTFDAEVIDSSVPVVVDFWAPWCTPCKMMAPILEEAARDYQGKIKFCKINVDQNPEAASRYKAMSIPLLVFFRNGQAADRSVGAVPSSQLRAKLDLFVRGG